MGTIVLATTISCGFSKKKKKKNIYIYMYISSKKKKKTISCQTASNGEQKKGNYVKIIGN